MVYDLKYIVSNVLLKPGVLDEKAYPYLLKHAINGYRKLNLHNVIKITTQTKRIVVDPNTNIANLPPDYLDWFKVAAIYRYWNGSCYVERIVNLDYNPNILGVDPAACTCECTTENFNAVAQSDPAAYGFLGTWFYTMPRYNNGQYTAGVYGAGSNIFRGAFVIDDKTQQIRIGSFVCGVTELLLEYKSTGISDEGNAVVPQGAIPALLAFVEWQSYLEKKELQMAREYQNIFRAEAASLNLRNNALTEKEFYTIMRQSVKQSPKV